MSTGTALTGNADFQAFTDHKLIPFTPAASTTFYKGQFVMIDASGLLTPVPINDGSTDNSAKRIVGQLNQQPRGSATSDASGAAPLAVRTSGVFECNGLAADSFAQSDVGTLVYATSDNEITKTSTKNPKVGILVGFSPVTGKPLVSMGISIPA